MNRCKAEEKYFQNYHKIHKILKTCVQKKLVQNPVKSQFKFALFFFLEGGN